MTDIKDMIAQEIGIIRQNLALLRDYDDPMRPKNGTIERNGASMRLCRLVANYGADRVLEFFDDSAEAEKTVNEKRIHRMLIIRLLISASAVILGLAAIAEGIALLHSRPAPPPVSCSLTDLASISEAQLMQGPGQKKHAYALPH